MKKLLLLSGLGLIASPCSYAMNSSYHQPSSYQSFGAPSAPQEYQVNYGDFQPQQPDANANYDDIVKFTSDDIIALSQHKRLIGKHCGDKETIFKTLLMEFDEHITGKARDDEEKMARDLLTNLNVNNVYEIQAANLFEHQKLQKFVYLNKQAFALAFTNQQKEVTTACKALDDIHLKDNIAQVGYAAKIGGLWAASLGGISTASAVLLRLITNISTKDSFIMGIIGAIVPSVLITKFFAKYIHAPKPSTSEIKEKQKLKKDTEGYLTRAENANKAIVNLHGFIESANSATKENALKVEAQNNTQKAQNRPVASSSVKNDASDNYTSDEEGYDRSNNNSFPVSDSFYPHANPSSFY